MFLIIAQNNFGFIFSSYVEGREQKYSSLNFMFSVAFQVAKIWMFFRKKIFVVQVWKWFSGGNSSLEALSVWFSNSILYGLEESRELKDLIWWVLG